MLANDRGPVLGNLHPRKTDSDHARHLAKEGVVTAGHLRAALDDVTSDNATREGVEVVSAPLVMPGRRTANERRVGDATGDDDVGTHRQRLGNAKAAQVGVGRDESRDVTDWFTGFEVCQIDASSLQFFQAPHEVVAVDVRDHGRETERGGDLGDGLGAALGVEASGIGDDLDASLQAGAHDLFHLGHKGSGVPDTRVFRLGPRQDEHGQLGQPVARQNVDGTVVDHLVCGRKTITEETRTVGDSQWRRHR